MPFTEKSHAFIAARFYIRLTEAFGERGRKAFIHATQYYAGQRGRRMAQRAIRDGAELCYGTYMQYGEWTNTPEVIAEGCANTRRQVTVSPDYVYEIHTCPWHTQFKEMGALEAGQEYCRWLDAAICRGFDPSITYRVTQSLNESDHCLHCILNAGIEEGKSYPKKTEYLKSFEYHCAHSYWAFSEVSGAIFEEEGKAVSRAVLEDFAAEYGRQMADAIAAYEKTNFNCC